MKPLFYLSVIFTFPWVAFSCSSQDKETEIPIAQSSNALVVIDSNDLLGEIKNESGEAPILPEELIFASNVFDAPLGKLTPIKDPVGAQLTLQDWKKAKGQIEIVCNGSKSAVQISLEGLVKNGTYTFWLNFINKEKFPGQTINFTSDVSSIQALGSALLNVQKASNDGIINTSIEHSKCLVNSSPTLVFVVVYHINGRTFGNDHIPDEEEVSHLLIYF